MGPQSLCPSSAQSNWKYNGRRRIRKTTYWENKLKSPNLLALAPLIATLSLTLTKSISEFSSFGENLVSPLPPTRPRLFSQCPVSIYVLVLLHSTDTLQVTLLLFLRDLVFPKHTSLMFGGIERHRRNFEKGKWAWKQSQKSVLRGTWALSIYRISDSTLFSVAPPPLHQLVLSCVSDTIIVFSIPFSFSFVPSLFPCWHINIFIEKSACPVSRMVFPGFFASISIQNVAAAKKVVI